MSVVLKIDMDSVLHQMEQVCSQLMGQTSYQELRQMITDFASDDDAVQRYEAFMEKKQTLQLKEQQGQNLSEDEIRGIEEEEYTIYDHAVIRRFLFARKEITKVHDAVSQYFIKAVELNRIPRAEELSLQSGCGCGGNCGC